MSDLRQQSSLALDLSTLPDALSRTLRLWSDTLTHLSAPAGGDLTDWDWLAFHERGWALCAELQAVLGDNVQVLYRKPPADPNHCLAGTTVWQPGRAFPRWPEARPDPQAPAGPVALLVSGGQTGADRAALDWAIGQGCPHAGWAPKGRLAADGVIPLRYQLTELSEGGYRQRMRRNVADSDATLVVNLGALDGGTWATLDAARRLGKPHLLVPLDDGRWGEQVGPLRDWLARHAVVGLNVAGPREEKRPGVHARTMQLLAALWAGAASPALS